MKTLMFTQWDGITSNQYDAVIEVLNWKAYPAKGLLFHTVGFSEHKMLVTDIWESEEKANVFVQNRLMPAITQVGLQGKPQMQHIPIHALFIPDPVRINTPIKSLTYVRWSGIHINEYEQLRREVNWEVNVPVGGIMHVAGFDSNGLCVMDIWESPEANFTFAQQRMMPVAVKMGIQSQPQIEAYPIHSVFLPDLQHLLEEPLEKSL